MKRILFVAFSAAVFNVSIAVAIIAHCGSTWVVQEPRLGALRSVAGCGMSF